MNIGQVMTRDVRTCHAGDSLQNAARIMWDADCGAVPVLDEHRQVIGIVTDRDACMAAYLQAKPLTEITVGSVMSTEVFSCKPEQPIAAAERLMKQKQVRRLPVLDAEGQLVGIVSLNDLVHAAERLGGKAGHAQLEEAALTLAAISHPRDGLGAAAAR